MTVKLLADLMKQDNEEINNIDENVDNIEVRF